MKFRKVVPLLGLALFAPGLSGCNFSSFDPYSVDVNMEIPEGTEVQFWTGFGEDISNALDKLLDEFTAETGIEVNHVTQSGYEGLFESITLSASSGNVPQLALAYPDHMASYVDSGILVQLDYYMETDEGEDKISADDFYSDYMQENFQIYFDENGDPYCMGVPFNKSTEVMSYNADFFDWASKRDSAIKVPETWQEVRTVGTKIRALMADCYGKYVGKDGVAYASRQDAVEKGGGLLFNFAAINEKNFIPFGYDSGANFFITTCRQWGGTYTEIDTDSRSGYLAFDSEEVREGLQYMKDLYDDGLIGVPSDFQNSGGYCSTPFKNFQVIANIGSSAGVENNVPASGAAFAVGVSHIPYNAEGEKYVISQGTNLVMLNSGTEAQRAAAWKLLKWLSKWHNGDFAAATGYFPSCEYSEESEVYRDFVTRVPNGSADKAAQEATVVNTEHYVNDEEGWTKFVDPPFVGSAMIRNAVDTAMDYLFDGDEGRMTPDGVISYYYQSLRDYVR